MKNFKSIVIFIALAAMQNSYGAMGDGSLRDTNIQYIGRWETSDTSLFRSNWAGSYLKTGFTGTTLKINLASPTNLAVNIDNTGDSLHLNVNGVVNCTLIPLKDTTHRVLIGTLDTDDSLMFKGLVLDPGAATVALPKYESTIEFVGNSITSGGDLQNHDLASFAWFSAEYLGCDHVQISYSGITLTDGYHYTYWAAPATGMSAAYFKTRIPRRYSLTETAPYVDWNFTRYTPKSIVINLGTNDGGVSVPGTIFQSTYTQFLQNVRAKNPNADIFALRTFNGAYEAQIQAATTACIAAGDAKLYFVNTTNWLLPADFPVPNGVHPSVAGQKKAARLVFSVLKPYFKPAVYNPGFEADEGPTNEPGAWQREGDSLAVYTENGGHTGAFRLTHWKTTSYSCASYQTIIGLANGVYTAKAWIKCSGGQTACSFYADSFGGTQVSAAITAAADWKQMTLPNINVSSNRCAIGFKSIALANNWLNVDDVEFTRDSSVGIPGKSVQNNSKPLQFSVGWLGPHVLALRFTGSGAVADTRVTVTDIRGRRLLEQSIPAGSAIKIDTRGLSKGTCFITVTTGHVSMTKKCFFL
jgi:lysophospholipase L1-like esterase